MARGDGATTRQMQGAAKDAHFVWLNGQLSYPRGLAAKIGREDLKIVSPDFFSGNGWRGIMFTEIVVDHAARFSERTDEIIDYARRAMIRPTDDRAKEK